MTPLEILLAREIERKPVCQSDLVRSFQEAKPSTIHGAVMSLMRQGFAFRKPRENFLGHALDLYLTEKGKQAVALLGDKHFTVEDAIRVPPKARRFKTAWDRMDYILLQMAFNKRTLAQLGHELGLSVQRVSQIRIAGLARYGATATEDPNTLVLHMRTYHQRNRNSSQDTLEGFHQTLYAPGARRLEHSPGRYDDHEV